MMVAMKEAKESKSMAIDVYQWFVRFAQLSVYRPP